jgi:class 3 adenylate cyclase
MQGDSNVNFAEELIPYVPPLVIRRLTAISLPSTKPAAEVYSAAVLFVDIKGFSALAENLSKRGSEGAEELALLLNDCFGHLIQTIIDHGGEITKFAGDALLAIWPVPADLSRVGRAARDILAKMVLKATQCAFSIQRSSDDLLIQRDKGSRLQIGVGAGDIYVVHLGGILNRWEYLLSGEPLVQMSVAKDLAASGDVVLAPEAWELVSQHCSSEHITGGFVRIFDMDERSYIEPNTVGEVSGEVVEGIRTYVPAAITRRLEAGFGQWLSEIRHLTILFVKLPGYGTSITHPYATTVPEAQAVMRAMQSSLYRYEGSINKFNVDDKGITLVAAMGLPPLSHKDDAARAVHIALDMQRTLKALDRPCAIGVASGWVFCGPIGNERRREYTVVGNSVNRAASLMQVAEQRRSKDGLTSYALCDEATFEGVSSSMQDESLHGNQLVFEHNSGVKLKGRKSPVTAYRPRVRRLIAPVKAKSDNEKGSLIGRQKERIVFNDHLQDLAHSDSFIRVLTYEGEEGIGKSTFLRACRTDATSRGVLFYRGGGIELRQNTSYHAWRPVFREIFDVDVKEDDIISLRNKVLRRLPTLPGEKGFPALALRLAPLLKPVLGLEFAENRMTKAMTPEIREQTTRLFLVRLLQRSFYDSLKHSHQPHVIFLDNGQWLDNDSWRLAVAVKDLVRPLLLVIASRPLHQDALGRPPHSSCAELMRERNLERLRLDQLSRAEMNAVHSELVAPSVVSEELSDALWRKCGGNPLFAKHMIQHWRELSVKSMPARETFHLDDSTASGEVPVPNPLQKIIVGRIDSLQPEQQMMLKAASHLDGSFSAGDLLRLLRKTGMQMDLTDFLRSLISLGLLNIAGQKPSERYRFANELIRDVTRQLLTTDQLKLFQAVDLMAS